MDTGSEARWRYVKAGDLNNDTVGFDRLQVRSVTSDEELGTIRGFIVDGRNGQLHYVVVDSGGWFSGGGRYLIPPAFTRVDAEQRVLWAEATRDALTRFPSFDEQQYPTLSRDQLWPIERRIIEAYGDDPGVVAPSAAWDRASWAQYRQPDWWREHYTTTTGAIDPAVATRAAADTGPGGLASVSRSPATDRAQPGDVLGIERGGETTALGDTAADEDQRRERSEKAFREAVVEEARDRAADRRRR